MGNNPSKSDRGDRENPPPQYSRIFPAESQQPTEPPPSYSELFYSQRREYEQGVYGIRENPPPQYSTIFPAESQQPTEPPPSYQASYISSPSSVWQTHSISEFQGRLATNEDNHWLNGFRENFNTNDPTNWENILIDMEENPENYDKTD